jgi:hypothetical protein
MTESTALDKGTEHEVCEIQDRVPLARAFDSRGARRHPLVSPLEPWIPLPSDDILAIWEPPGLPALKAQPLANDVQTIRATRPIAQSVCLTNRQD